MPHLMLLKLAKLPAPRFFLAQRGFKVANYPVIPDEDPPEQLFNPSLQLLGLAMRKRGKAGHSWRKIVLKNIYTYII